MLVEMYMHTNHVILWVYIRNVTLRTGKILDHFTGTYKIFYRLNLHIQNTQKKKIPISCDF